MKFTANTKDLMDGLNIATRALATRPATSVLEGVLIECDEESLAITCTDGQISIRWTGTALSVSDPGSAIIPGKLLADLMRRLPNTSVTVTTDKNSATITYGKSRSHISILPGEYPQPQEMTSPTTISVPAGTLRDMITHILPAIAVENSRPILTGGCMDISPDCITCVALDGFRLALMRCDQHNDVQDNIKAIIPRKTLSELSKLLPYSDEQITIQLTRSSIHVSLGSAQITSVLLSGEYIDYSRMLPDSFRTSILIRKADLQESLERAALVARNGQNKLIRMEISNNILSVSSRSETGNIIEEIDCDQNGDDLIVSFNSDYISDAIRNTPDDTVTLNFNSPFAPVIFYPVQSRDWMFLVLPVRT